MSESTTEAAGTPNEHIDSKHDAERASIIQAYKNPHYRYLVLGILTTVYVSNFVDRQVINVLASYIIEDLAISDGQFGMLSGLAFACIYTTLGIPIARWADISNRRNVIAISVTIWSIMTAACGAAQNFSQLFLARFGVGIGEAGGSPPAHSIVSDIFPAHQRATALSVYSLGVYGGILVGTVGGAYLVQFFDWRIAFVVVGLPGIFLALLVRFVIKEPPRGMAEARKDVAPPGFFRVVGFLWERKSFRHLSFACALHAFVTYGMGNFMPLFLGRVHGMPILDVGLYYGLIAGIGGLAGTFFGGWMSDRMANNTGDKTWYVWIPFISTLLAIPFALITFLLMPTGVTAAFSYLLPVFAGGWYLAPCIASTHFLVGIRMRAMASAVLLFVLNLIGLGLGPMLTGFVSDYLTPSYGDNALRYAMSITVMVNLWCALHYYWATRTIRADFDRAPD
ncbi:MAG TPA: MFS transporter [Gammaproteobacteria bacterium]|jgi:MFS family permease|nr:MFS transporter [Gammaproteobacteria bacterium]HIN89100.1 MFS transporter [Porticoccaceae bacterium]